MSIKTEICITLFCVLINILPGVVATGIGEDNMQSVDLWKLANEKKDILK